MASKRLNKQLTTSRPKWNNSNSTSYMYCRVESWSGVVWGWAGCDQGMCSRSADCTSSWQQQRRQSDVQFHLRFTLYQLAVLTVGLHLSWHPTDLLCPQWILIFHAVLTDSIAGVSFYPCYTQSLNIMLSKRETPCGCQFCMLISPNQL